MICECSSCSVQYEVSGQAAIEVLTGGKECPRCGGNINIVIAEVKKAKK